MQKTLLYRVEKVLRDCPEARDNDDVMYYIYLATYHEDLLKMNLGTFLIHSATSKAVPNRESVGRLRRRLQEEYPELKSIDKARTDKKIKEDKWREFANETI